MDLGSLEPHQIEVLRRATRAKTELDRLAHEWPLAFARLWAPECRTCPHPSRVVRAAFKWHRGMPLVHLDGMRHECPSCGEITLRTNQQVAAQTMIGSSVIRAAFALGGNRSSKSELGAHLDVAFALGSDHPAVRRWLEANDLDNHLIQPGPGRVWVSSLTFPDAREYVRPKLDKYMPSATRRRSWGADNQAEARLPGGGTIVSKAVRQGQGAYQGKAIHAARFDEEPRDPAVVQECDFRLTDHRGPKFFTMSPLHGWTPLLVEYLGHMREGKALPSDTVMVSLVSTDNVYIDPDEMLRKLARYSESVRRARLLGEITALEGRVHEEWDRAVHVVPAFDPPQDWPRFAGMDFGFRNPFAHLWFALDQRDDVLHVYREHYQRETLIREHAEAIWSAECCPSCYPDDAAGSDGWWSWVIAAGKGDLMCDTCGGTGRTEPEPIERWADPEGLSDRQTLARDYGLVTRAAVKSRRVSFDALSARLQIDGSGKPHVVIHDNCTETIREFEGLTWDDARQAEMETKGDDHAHDVVRYVCLGIAQAGYGEAVPE
mgnify:CR=1 FL=1